MENHHQMQQHHHQFMNLDPTTVNTGQHHDPSVKELDFFSSTSPSKNTHTDNSNTHSNIPKENGSQPLFTDQFINVSFHNIKQNHIDLSIQCSGFSIYACTLDSEYLILIIFMLCNYRPR